MIREISAGMFPNRQGAFVGKAIENGRRRLLRGREHDQHAITQAFCAATRPSAEGESTILPQDLKATNSMGAEPRR
jgi:hypothetical protein